ncbi:MAG: hypothetical protein KJ587_18535 [Alphaproteobacteria bacterium]|nr:hypothetical protein [Alphaproteobacteria bacterium]
MCDPGENLSIDLNPALQAGAESDEVQTYTFGRVVQQTATDAQLHTLNTARPPELADVVGEIADVDGQRAGGVNRVARRITVRMPVPLHDRTKVVAGYAHALQFEERRGICAVTANGINVRCDRGSGPPLQLQKMSQLQVNIAVIETPLLRLAIGFLGGFEITLLLHRVPVLHPDSAQIRIDPDGLPIRIGRCRPPPLIAIEIAEPDRLLGTEGFDEADEWGAHNQA